MATIQVGSGNAHIFTVSLVVTPFLDSIFAWLVDRYDQFINIVFKSIANLVQHRL